MRKIRYVCLNVRQLSTGRFFTCGWEGDEDDLKEVETFPGRPHGDPPEPREWESACPECGDWLYLNELPNE